MTALKLKPGTLCLIEEDEAECENVATHEPGALQGGTPVRVVSVEEIDCPARVDGECKSPCRIHFEHEGSCTTYNITVEDAQGERWINCLCPCDEEDTYPFAVLEDVDAEYLLSKEAHKQYKLCEFTDDGFPPAIPIMLAGFASIVFAYTLTLAIEPLWAKGALLAFEALIALCCIAKVIACHVYLRHKLSCPAQYFLSNFEANKKALETLLKKTPNNP